MPIFDLFSKRQKRLRGEVPDVYTYDKIPQNLRVQIVHIIRDAIGEENNIYGSRDLATPIYDNIFNALCREYGKFKLIEGGYNDTSYEQVLNFLLSAENTEEVLDVIELTFKYISLVITDDYRNYTTYTNVKISPENAIIELNNRFKENGIGFSFESNEL